MTPILCALFFLSGAAALLFENLWFRQAGLAFGNGVWASSLVLAGFMGGLACGNALMARFGARVRRPVRFYALLEVAIGATGVALVWGLPRFGAWLSPWFEPLLDEPWLLNPLRFGIGFVLLLLPATAMGATLPVLVKALLVREPNFGAVLGRLYGWNTLGAVVGSVLGELWLLEWFGVRGTGWVAGGCNAAAALIALALARRMGGAAEAAWAAAAVSRAALGAAAARTLAAAFGTGAILLALEVVWFRFLHLFVHSGSLVFSLMLAVVLAGIALGGFAGGRWLRRDSAAERHAPVLAFAAGALVVVLYAGFEFPLAPQAPVLLIETGAVLQLASFLMLPVATLSGLLFTFLGARLHAVLGSETRATGLLTLANTLGGALGSGLAGFVLLPQLGVERSFLFLALGYGAVAALVLRTRGDVPRASRRPSVVAALVFAVVLALFPFGKFADVYLASTIARSNPGGADQVVAVREGRTETAVYLRKTLDGATLRHRLLTDGFAMSATSVFARRYQKLYVYWPVALHPDPRRALVISYGVGNTAKALVDTRSLEHIDVVDISRDLLELSELLYPDPSQHPLRDPRVRVHIEDGRFFLQATDERYDLITGEPPPPKNAGVVNLYTREYFQLIYDRLAPGGITTYWLPAHNTLESDTRAILRAFCDVFVDCSLWSGNDLDWMLVGTRGATFTRSEAAFARQWHDPELLSELQALGLELPEQLGALFMADAAQLQELLGDALPLTDDRPKRLANGRHSPDAARRTYRAWMDPATKREQFRRSEFVARAWPEGMRERTLPYFDVQHLLDASAAGERVDFAERLREVHGLLSETPLVTAPLWRLGVTHDQLRAIDERLAQGAPPGRYRDKQARWAVAQRDYERAALLLQGVQRPRDPTSLYFRISVLALAGRSGEAQELLDANRAQLPDDATARAVFRWLQTTFGLETPTGTEGTEAATPRKRGRN